jgi:hypothetical protein
MSRHKAALALTVAVALASAAFAPAPLPKPERGKAKWTRGHLAKVRPGMPFHEVEAALGPKTAVNPKPPPFPYGGAEVLVLWGERRAQWIAVVFVPDAGGVLRVPESGTYLSWGGL